jgi:4-alpha-glucanotransferase
VQTAYYGLHHRRQTASIESLLAALKALGAPLVTPEDVSSALRERRQSLYRRIMEPVMVAWDEEPTEIKVCLPSICADAFSTGRLVLESGESFDWRWGGDELPVVASADVEGVTYITKKIVLPVKLPTGYHKFFFQAKGISGEAMIIIAPRKDYSPGSAGEGKEWGVFLPLYALRTDKDWGGGDYTGLGDLTDWVAERGGKVVGTLPLLPVFLDKPYEPSPYNPVSRLLWNEFYIDVTTLPELAESPKARALVASAAFQSEIKKQRKKDLVDYRMVMSLKRKVMEELAQHVMESPGRRGGLERFTQENPIAEEYACFQAVMEKQGAPWTDWPPSLRDGVLTENDYDGRARDYYHYAQWLAHQQIAQVAENARRKGVKLYFDLPVGIHPFGYDVWRHRDVFTRDAEVGAPPDAVFTTGQNWWSLPLHPEHIREQHYRYVIDYLRHHLKYADMLRIDHVMGLHRLFWIPRGFDARQGVYVRYFSEELYAILALESHRHGSIIVGEDMGTVPAYVRPAMVRHGIHRMYILYYELTDNAARTFKHVPRNAVAGLNTHDMPPFAAFWEGTDIPERKTLGILDETGARQKKQSRRLAKTNLTTGLRQAGLLAKAATGTGAVLRACLAYLSQSQAHTVLVNLEDLWQGKRTQNIPGTGEKYPSWRYKARYRFEAFCRRQDVSDILEMIDGLRKKRKRPRHGK